MSGDGRWGTEKERESVFDRKIQKKSDRKGRKKRKKCVCMRAMNGQT